jgi:hypothetical protein
MAAPWCALLLWMGCSPPRLPGDLCVPGVFRCSGNVLQVCGDDGARFVDRADCSLSNEICAGDLGCVTCLPNTRSCDGFDIVRCNPDGSGSDRIATCDGQLGDICSGGNCINGCELAAQSHSYEGCEYFAVDLDNAVVATQGTAAAQQFAVVLSNSSDLVASVTVEIMCTEEDAANPALQCTAGQPHVIDQFPVAPRGLAIVNLDPREVDGTSSPSLNDGPGTYRSSAAYRIASDAPLVAYQFNPLENVNVFSNDASLLLPTASLDTRYMVLSWPQTLAVTSDGATNGGIDLRAFLTIVGIADETFVTVKLATDILGGADIGPAAIGDTITFTLDRFEVINLETGGFNADFTGTSIRSEKPVAVFAGSEASDVPMFESFLERSCCADHMEQQLFPESALGKSFVAVKTPLRTKYIDAAGWNVALVPDEPEWWRVLATSEDTTISTNLPPPDNNWLLQRGQSAVFRTERDFVLSANRPVALAQFPGGQYTAGIPSTLPGGERPPGGDPSFILLPPIEQWRQSYLFLVPNKYAFDFLLIAAATSADIYYDGLPVDSVLSCEYELIGTLGEGQSAVEYQAIRCPLSAPLSGGGGLQDDGVHTLESMNGDAIGLVVYGWDSFVSYGYPGGANIEFINPL